MADITGPIGSIAGHGGRLAVRLEWILLFGSVLLIPYDFPVIHQACLPLAVAAILLVWLRRDSKPFLAFMRSVIVLSALAFLVCAFGLLSLYGNFDTVLGVEFQGEQGWSRGLIQAFLLVITAFFPFYLAFCLCRHADWHAIVTRAAWWSVPIPMLVGLLQLANFVGLHAVAHLPFVGGAYEGGFFRITSVAREPSWFGSYFCVLLPFLWGSLAAAGSRVRKWGGMAVLAIMLLLYFFGFSKSAYAALVLEVLVLCLTGVIFRWPGRVMAKTFVGLSITCVLLILLAVLAPTLFGKVTDPFVARGLAAYQLFKPLLTGDTKFVSIGTRFGMSAAGIAMGESRPVLGAGLGQFGFHAQNFIPMWGVNDETVNWLSNDTHQWPSTSNLFTRLIAEIGLVGALFYLVIRVLLVFAMGLRLLRKDDPLWWRDRAIFAILIALTIFDFHRDSFINLDMWVAMGMAIASLTRGQSVSREVGLLRSGQAWRFFGVVAAVSFCIMLCLELSQQTAFQAHAVLIPKSHGIAVEPQQIENESPSVGLGGRPDSRFWLFRVYWGSRSVATRLIADDPALVQTVLKSGRPIVPSELADYISANIAVLLADKQTTLTLEYNNPDPQIALRFLTKTIEETDRAVSADSAAAGTEAANFSRLVAKSGMLSVQDRQTMIANMASRELQNVFDRVGENASFDYVERPAVSLEHPIPQPGHGLIFAIAMAFLTALTATIGYLLFVDADRLFVKRHPAPA
ncbi:MAG TPA: O-antigen ligase family protein [Rhizomicrobium sp.]|nr:O-antigen ligase family protein [Rhizomicrobium sp.]